MRWINEVYVHDVMSMHIRILSAGCLQLFMCFDGFKFYDQSIMNFLVALYQLSFIEVPC